MIKFERLTPCWRVYSVEVKGKYYDIERIKIYDNDGIVCEGLFHDSLIKEDKVINFYIPTIVKKMKEKFNKVEAYILKNNEIDYHAKPVYDVYIHKDLVHISEPTYELFFGSVKECYIGDGGLKITSTVYKYDNEVTSKIKELHNLSGRINWISDVEKIRKIMVEMNRVFEELESAKKKADAFTLSDYFQMIGVDKNVG